LAKFGRFAGFKASLIRTVFSLNVSHKRKKRFISL